MISVYATPDCRQIHISFDEREPLPQAPLVLFECFEDSDRKDAWRFWCSSPLSSKL